MIPYTTGQINYFRDQQDQLSNNSKNLRPQNLVEIVAGFLTGLVLLTGCTKGPDKAAVQTANPPDPDNPYGFFCSPDFLKLLYQSLGEKANSSDFQRVITEVLEPMTHSQEFRNLASADPDTTSAFEQMVTKALANGGYSPGFETSVYELLRAKGYSIPFERMVSESKDMQPSPSFERTVDRALQQPALISKPYITK